MTILYCHLVSGQANSMSEIPYSNYQDDFLSKPTLSLLELQRKETSFGHCYYNYSHFVTALYPEESFQIKSDKNIPQCILQ